MTWGGAARGLRATLYLKRGSTRFEALTRRLPDGSPFTQWVQRYAPGHASLRVEGPGVDSYFSHKPDFSQPALASRRWPDTSRLREFPPPGPERDALADAQRDELGFRLNANRPLPKDAPEGVDPDLAYVDSTAINIRPGRQSTPAKDLPEADEAIELDPAQFDLGRMYLAMKREEAANNLFGLRPVEGLSCPEHCVTTVARILDSAKVNPHEDLGVTSSDTPETLAESVKAINAKPPVLSLPAPSPSASTASTASDAIGSAAADSAPVASTAADAGIVEEVLEVAAVALL